MMETAKKSLPDFSVKLDGGSHALKILLTYLLWSHRCLVYATSFLPEVNSI